MRSQYLIQFIIATIIIIVFSNCTGNTPSEYKNDLEKEGLKGDIRTITTRLYTSSIDLRSDIDYPNYIKVEDIPKRNLHSTTIVTYNLDGNVSSEETTYADKTVWHNYEYSNKNNSITTIQFMCDNDPSCKDTSSIEVLTFNNKGELIEETHKVFSEQNAFTFKKIERTTTYKHKRDENGRQAGHLMTFLMISKSGYSDIGVTDSLTNTTSWEFTGHIIDTIRILKLPTSVTRYSDGKLKEVLEYSASFQRIEFSTKKYNRKGLLSEEIIDGMYLEAGNYDFTNHTLFNPNDFDFSREVYEYDEKDNFVSILKLDKDGGIKNDNKYKYLYNDLGKLIEEKEYEDKELIRHSITQYDDKGSLVDENTFTRFDGASIKAFVLKKNCVYDKYGNIVYSVEGRNETSIIDNYLSFRKTTQYFYIRDIEIEYNKQ